MVGSFHSFAPCKLPADDVVDQGEDGHRSLRYLEREDEVLVKWTKAFRRCSVSDRTAMSYWRCCTAVYSCI